jgi:hypothetical protein
VAAQYLYTGAQRAIRGEGGAGRPCIVAVPALDLTEVLCVQEERVVGNDNCVAFLNRKLQIPESPLRAHFVRATVKVHQYPTVGWRSSMAGCAWDATTATGFSARRSSAGPSQEQNHRCLLPSAWRRARDCQGCYAPRVASS